MWVSVYEKVVYKITEKLIFVYLKRKIRYIIITNLLYNKFLDFYEILFSEFASKSKSKKKISYVKIKEAKRS